MSSIGPHAREFTPQISTKTSAGRNQKEEKKRCNLIARSMATLKQLLLILALLCMEGSYAGNSTAVYVPCEGGSNRLLQLEELIHISDVVMYGLVSTETISQDEFGTFSASVSYYFAYKRDRLLARRGLATVNVVNFPERPGGESSFFFLVRQPNTELSLYCMSTLGALDRTHETQYTDLFVLVEDLKTIATADMERNRQFVPPYPDPCNSIEDNHIIGSRGSVCSLTGSQCSVVNTLSNETTRCICITGFHGDGFVCTERTEEAAKMECPECRHGARCVFSSRPEDQGNSIPVDTEEDREELIVETVVNCSCDHFKCRGQATSVLCGTDGVTYSNECHMRKKACQLQKDIHKVHDGECQPQPVHPCIGLGTPLSTSAGLVTCSETRDCPPLHFCHSTDTFQVCCPVTAPISPTTQRPAVPIATSSPHSSSGSGMSDDEEEDGVASGSGAMEGSTEKDDIIHVSVYSFN